MRVLFLPEVVDQFLELADILYENGYLGFQDAALEYSEELFRDIQTNLPLKVGKGAPAYFERYGTDLFYSAFPHNKHTTWYVFYSVHIVDGETVYLVRYLTTTPTIEGRTIVEYKGVVFGEVIAGVDFVRDIAASIRNFVVGIDIDYEVLGSNNGMLMVTASGTAVKLG